MASNEAAQLKIGLSFDDSSMSHSASKIEKIWSKVGDSIVRDVAVKAFGAVTNAAKSFASGIVDTGKAFESSMSEVAAISGATGDDLAMLEKTARDFGASTQFSASEAADTLKYMALAGWDTC